jgi:hypothetical protein
MTSDLLHCVELARLEARTALDALRLIDHMEQSLLAGDAENRATTRAECTTRTFFGVDFIPNELGTFVCGTALFENVYLEFLAEVFDGGQHRIGCGHSKAA